MQTRIIHTRIWQDSFISDLNAKEKLLFIYLLCNPSINLIGIYELPDKFIKFDLDLTQTEIDLGKEKFSNKGKIHFYNGWIKVVNYEKYNNYTGAMNEKAKEKQLASVPDNVLKYFDTVSIQYMESIDTLSNKKSEIRNKKSEIRNSDVTRNDFMLQNFNEITGSKFKILDNKTIKQIDKLFESGFQLSDWGIAVTNAAKNPYLMGKNDGKVKYLTPEYISRLDKFQQWLQKPNSMPVKVKTPEQIAEEKHYTEPSPVIRSGKMLSFKELMRQKNKNVDKLINKDL